MSCRPSIFGLFRLLGYPSSPRLADAGHTLFYRADPAADYGPRNPLTTGRIRTRTIPTRGGAGPRWHPSSL
ncbi:Tn3 family transposase [Streptomyces phyllanthi]|uniref:Tn3 family transposase n=1 Tax=Streptomyces phyllanthi TaxID=1803180 RepID=UPI00128CB0FE|nr:Tn3 family transposase [Streptomyces phyllanthi]